VACSRSQDGCTASKAIAGMISQSFAWSSALVLLHLKYFISGVFPGNAARPPVYRVLVHRHFSLPWTTELYRV